MSNSPSKAAPKARRRGRPAQLSREQILSAALELLAEGPDKVTMSGVARSLNSAPMSLYSHVANRDDLLAGVADLVLGEIEIQVDEAADWPDQLLSWARQLHSQISAKPQVLALISESTLMPPHWVRLHAQLVRIFVAMGLEGQMLASTAMWFAQLVINDIAINNPVRAEAHRHSLAGALEGVSDEDRAEMQALVVGLAHTQSSLFDFSLERALASLEQLLAEKEIS